MFRNDVNINLYVSPRHLFQCNTDGCVETMLAVCVCYFLHYLNVLLKNLRFAGYPGVIPYMSYISVLGFLAVVVFQTGIVFDQLWTTEWDRKPRYYHSRWIWPNLKLVFTPVWNMKWCWLKKCMDFRCQVLKWVVRRHFLGVVNSFKVWRTGIYQGFQHTIGSFINSPTRVTVAHVK